MEKTRKHAHVLQDHFKKGSTFYPPFTYDRGVCTFDLINWRADFVPELIWLALLIQDHDFDVAKRLACDLAFFADQSEKSSQKHDFGVISAYSILSNESKSWILNKLSAHSNLQKLRSSLSALVLLYPDCPLSFICETLQEKPEEQQAYTSVGKALDEMLFRGEKLPTLAQGIYYDIQITTDKMQFVPPLMPKNTDVLKDYPDSEEAKMVASSIRASTLMMKLNSGKNNWARYFWDRGHEHGGCIIPSEDDMGIGAIPQEMILYHQECFRKYSERANEIWESVEKHYRIDFYNPVKDEILLGLACRTYRLTIHLVSFIPNWTEDISEVFVRMVLESYIYYRWFRKNGTTQDYEKFREYGLGQQKLRMEHLNEYFNKQGLSEKEAEEKNLNLAFLKKHKMPEFVPVKIGNPLDKNLRIIADEADCREIYAMMYSPASSAVHGIYDSLDLFYSKTCTNPFHCRHKVPYHWSKSAVSTYGPFNCLGITDWVLWDLLSTIGQGAPEESPGHLFIMDILDRKGFDEFSEQQHVQEWIRKTESFEVRSKTE